MSNWFRQAGWIIEDFSPIIGGKPGIGIIFKTPMGDEFCVVLFGDWRCVAEVKMGLSAIAAALTFIIYLHAHSDNPVSSFVSFISRRHDVAALYRQAKGFSAV